MFTHKKSMEFLYYISLLTNKELEADKKKLEPNLKELASEYREVYSYIIGNIFRLSPKAEKIYRDLLDL